MTIKEITGPVRSKYTGYIYKISFEDDKKNIWTMRICTSYRNYKHWQPFCENKEKAVGVICEGLKKETGMYNTLNADFLEKTRIAGKLGGNNG